MKSLKKIKKHCKESSPSCSGCQMVDEEGYCMFNNPPCKWDLKSIKKALKKVK